MRNPCSRYLQNRDCEEFVLCVLRQKGYEIIEYDAHGYDILARYPGGLYDYYIEVKCGLEARLSEFQKLYRMAIKEIAPKVGYNARYVICHFDDDGTLIGDEACRRLLRGYI